MLTRAAAAQARLHELTRWMRGRRRKQAKATKATKATTTKKVKKAKKVKKTYQTRCSACDTMVMSWRKGGTARFPITTTISEKFHVRCVHVVNHVVHHHIHDTDNVSMCAACVVKFYKDDFVSGKIMRCFAPGCTAITNINRFMSTEDCVARKKKMPNPRKNPLPKELTKLRAYGQVQRCPGCGLICERISGCGHMNCPQCSMNFNYDTGKPIP